MAREYDEKSIPIALPKHRHNRLLDFGDLWSVTSGAKFTIAECLFKYACFKYFLLFPRCRRTFPLIKN